MDTELLGTCSQNVKKGLEYLHKKIKEQKEDLSLHDTLSIHLLSCFDKQLLQDFLSLSQKDDFWEDAETWAYEQQELLFYCTFFEIVKNKNFLEVLKLIKNNQTKQGKIAMNDHEHAVLLLLFSKLEPESDFTKEATVYLVRNWEEIHSEMGYHWDYQSLASAILSLSEIDYFGFEKIIKKMALKLISFQDESGFIGVKEDLTDMPNWIFNSTAVSIQALSRIKDFDDAPLKKAVSWLKNQQLEDGSWGKFPGDTAECLLALFDVGEGPKVALQSLEWEKRLQLQMLNYKKPIFIKTIPPLDINLGSKELQVKILSMIKSAKSEIKILSLYFDMMYEDIIDFCKEHVDISVKIITRPKGDVTGLRGKIAQNVIDILNIATKGNVRKNELLHTRLIIVDKKEMIVSSADLTRDQMVDEFNAGIYLRDPDAIKEALNFFEKVWDNSSRISS